MTIADYERTSCTVLGGRLRSGKLTIPQIAKQALYLVDSLDGGGPELASVLAVNPAASTEAETLQDELRAGHARSPLHGMPVLVKDNIDTCGPLPTTAGSLALAGHSPAADADVVLRLREAGTLVLGKANLSEWGNFRASRSTRGWSAVRGLVRNPHLLDRSAAGSSSGSAAAVAAGIVPLAIGTETDGSIVAPAAVNGIVGLKPTVGLVSQRGIVPISENQDTAGPMARSVRDAALLLDAIADRPPQPAHGMQAVPGRYADCCDSPELDCFSVGIAATDRQGVHPAALDAMSEAARALARQGVRVVEDVTLPASAELAEADYELTVLLYDCKWDLDAYLDRRRHPGVRTIDDVIQFNRAHAAEELQHFGQDLLERAAAKGPKSETEYTAALASARRCGRQEGIDYALKHSQIDCLITPGFGPAWKSDLIYGDGPDLNHMASPAQAAAVAGYPLLTVPAGSVGGLPVGVTLMGGAFSESMLLRLGQAIESGLGAGMTPAFRTPGPG
jgi:amidase